eukprot:TCONS_00000002-protein
MASAACRIEVEIPADERKWPWFLVVSGLIFSSGLILIIIGRILLYFFHGAKRRSNSVIDMNEVDELEEEEFFLEDLEQGWYLDLKEGAGNLVSAQTLQGRILVVLSFVFNLAECALYITETGYPIEHCLDLSDQTLWRVEICLNAFFIFHFLIRFIAANDKLSFWAMEPLTYVDIVTVPAVFVAVYLGRNWLGLRFLRVIYLINLADILQFLNVLHTGSSLEMAQMIGNFLALTLASAGIVHLLENTGDPWEPINYTNKQKLNYFECLYFLFVTMSTVGYGDIYCHTYLGRLFNIGFISVGLGLFTSYLPAIQEFLASHTKYDRAFKPTPGKRHVIVAGYITEESVTGFFKDFLHPDREDSQTTVVILSPKYPSLKMQADLQRHCTKASYFIGTIYKFMDCHRTRMREADAVIILCNKKCISPDEEDAANITRVISVKNYHENIRCIVQLMMNKNKSHLLNCPQWNRELGDDIICIDELKLGFVAQSCNAPGFSTLLANLFAMRSDTISEEIQESEKWKVAYMIGAANEMYTAQLSNAFIGMSFPQAVELCFEKLNLMLIAIEMKISKKERYFAINPNDKKLRLLPGTRGFFFAQDASDVAKASKYCAKCHKDLQDPERMVKCKCRRRMKQEQEKKNPAQKGKYETKVDVDPVHLLEAEPDEAKKDKQSLTGDYFASGEKPKFDQSGTFYWCETRSYISARMSLGDAAERKFKNHVVVLVLSQRLSPPLGLRQLVLPLRASNRLPHDVKKVVILGDGDFLAREWPTLANFPDVDIVPGSPYNRSDLRAVNVNTADMCILLSPGHGSEEDEHQALSDKEVILVTLNLKAMTFDESELAVTEEIKKVDSSRGTSINGESSADVRVGFSSGANSRAATRMTGRPETSMSHMTAGGNSMIQEVKKTFKGALNGANIPMITELVCDSNAMYIDQDDMNIYDDDGIFLTQPYACGSAFTVSVLDSLVSATYFNSDVLTLVRNLVTGSVSPELDELLAEGKQPSGSYETQEIAAVRNRCRVAQISLFEGPLSEYGECGLFGDLFLYALRTYNMICLGLYRFRDSQRMKDKIPSTKRYVITFPPFNFVLDPTDLVFVLMQFEKPKRKRKSVSRVGSVASRFSGAF